jgi:predicted permease
MIRRIFALFRNLLQRSVVEQELDEEIHATVDILTDEKVRQGILPEEARRQALIEVGGVEQVKERVRSVKTGRFFLDFHRDMQFSMRLLRRNPGFTAVAVITLAFGIGANTAIFSAVNGILLRPLPYPDPSRLITIQREQVAYYITFAQLHDIQQQCAALERIATYNPSRFLLTGGIAPKEISAAYVSSDFFSLLRTKPMLGRPILPGDMQPGNDRVAILNYGLWMDEFGGDPGIVGRSILVGRKPYTVVGVMPREFGVGILGNYLVGSNDGSHEGMWLPQVLAPGALNGEAGPLIIARLKTDATLAQVNAQLQPLSARFAEAYRAGTQGLQLHARSMDLGIDPQVRTGLLILLGAVGFVLLMACVNVTSLLVVRSWIRQRELAIRKSLGATRLRILRQFLAESLLLALAGGALGLFISVFGIRILRLLAPPNTPRVDRILLDGKVLCFTMGVSLLVAVLVGLAPALQASSRRMATTLKESLGGSFVIFVMKRPHRLRSALVVLEVILAVILVLGGALMAHSFYKLMSVDTGVSADRVLTMHVQFSDLIGTYRDADWGAQEKKCWMGAQNALNGIRRMPGVQRVALSLGGPFSGSVAIGHYPGSGRSGLYMDGLPDDQLPAGQWISGHSVTPEFFAALGIRIIKGRYFEPRDMNSRVAIVSESFARKYIAGNPLKKRFNTGQPSWMEIIGVVNDVRDHSVMEPLSPVYYFPLTAIGTFGFDVIVQTSANPFPLIPAITRVVQSVDKDALITNVRTVDKILANSAAEPKFQTALLGSFGALGLILAIIGIYGVISYSVVQQTHEIGVRMALGAQGKDILHMILRKGMLLVITGIAIGMGGALALTRVLRNMLFEIKPTDPATFVGAAIFLVIAALAACYVPARQAAKLDPIAALRRD